MKKVNIFYQILAFYKKLQEAEKDILLMQVSYTNEEANNFDGQPNLHTIFHNYLIRISSKLLILNELEFIQKLTFHHQFLNIKFMKASEEQKMLYIKIPKQKIKTMDYYEIAPRIWSKEMCPFIQQMVKRELVKYKMFEVGLLNDNSYHQIVHKIKQNALKQK